MEHLIIALEAPMMSFGDTLTDTRGPTRSFPGVSAVTGLLANALGWRRTQPERLQALHDSLLIGSRIDRDPMGGRPALDYQTADLNHDDAGWTTHGVVETRSGEAKTFESQHLRFREYIPDCRVITALRANPGPGDTSVPSIDEMMEALIRPARPLFIGRKPFIPSTNIFHEIREADNILQALLETPPSEPDEMPSQVRLCWPATEGDPLAAGVSVTQRRHISDLRNWHTRLHGGRRPVLEGTIPKRTLTGQ